MINKKIIALSIDDLEILLTWYQLAYSDSNPLYQDEKTLYKKILSLHTKIQRNIYETQTFK